MKFPFKDKDGYNIDVDLLCPLRRGHCVARSCALFEICDDGITGYCGLSRGESHFDGARLPSFERGRLS